MVDNEDAAGREDGPRGSGELTGRPVAQAATAAERVASIVAAAEQAADAIRRQAERRLRDRIAEGERAAQYRVHAAEDEAAEIVRLAQQEAARLRDAAEGAAEGEKTRAVSEALTIVAKAKESAKQVIDEAQLAAAAEREEAQTQARELLRDARTTVNDVRTEGLEIAGNLRQLGDALRSNAERLLRDVQLIHSRMLSELDRLDDGLSRRPSVGAVKRGRESDSGEGLDVPEFIPPT